MNLNFLDWFAKNNPISNVMKIRLVEPSYFMRTDRQLDGQQTWGHFYNIANAHKIYTKKTKEITNYECDLVLNNQIDKTPVASPILI